MHGGDAESLQRQRLLHQLARRSLRWSANTNRDGDAYCHANPTADVHADGYPDSDGHAYRAAHSYANAPTYAIECHPMQGWCLAELSHLQEPRGLR